MLQECTLGKRGVNQSGTTTNRLRIDGTDFVEASRRICMSRERGEKIVQRILRHTKPHVAKGGFIKAFAPAVLAAMKRLEATFDVVSQSAPRELGQLW